MTPTAPSKHYTPYYRVSTQKQGASGLGLEAQQAAVRTFVADPSQLLGEFVEIESGKKNQRPQLLAAIAEARRIGSTLLIAKLDRLSRNASFILALRDSGVDFVCCDMPATLGTPANLTDAARQQSLLVRRARSQQHPGLRQAAAFIDSRRAQGVSFRQLAGELNTLGFTAPRGGPFNQKQVQRLYERLPVAGKNLASE